MLKQFFLISYALLMFTLSYAQDMVKVQAGKFTMGATSEQKDEKPGIRESPTHEVEVKSFMIGKYPVTVAEFREFINATHYKTDAENNGGSFIYYKGKDNVKIEWHLDSSVTWKNGTTTKERPASEDNHPVVNVSWNDAMAYCKWLSEKKGKHYRLPSEAEWEYAARGGNQSKKYKYSGSNNIEDVAWCEEKFGSNTHPVGKKKANELGIYDMSGNVWVWCSDYYSDYTEEAIQYPKGPETGISRILRGGRFYHIAWVCRVSCRYQSKPNYSSCYYGFRIAMDAE